MAPDRGSATGHSASYQTVEQRGRSASTSSHDDGAAAVRDERRRQQLALAASGAHDTNFTVRGVLVGLAIGLIICFSNVYFGLQTGWISGMAMPSALIGFAFFKSMARCIPRPFTPVENVLVQTVAGAVGTMPLGAGLVGVMPALNYLLKDEERGPIDLGLGKLVVWSVGICFLGVFVAVPLRREFIIREKLRFPSGTATALMIRVLHGQDTHEPAGAKPSEPDEGHRHAPIHDPNDESQRLLDIEDSRRREDWQRKIRLLIVAFGLSSIYTLSSYFIPQLHGLPIFGLPLARGWEWAFNPSPAYVGQGIIMGPSTSFHMLFGALLGWAILSPLAKSRGWAPGPVDDWETGSKGWIVWVSLAIMLADSVVSLGWLALRPVVNHGREWTEVVLRSVMHPTRSVYTRLSTTDSPGSLASMASIGSADTLPEVDAPPSQLPPNRIVYPGFFLAILVCTASVHIVFPDIIPLWATLLAIFFSLILSLMGIKALGETDLNPVSGISKLAQLAFAAILPHHPSTVTINLLAGAISESTAMQAGDLLQDMKAGHLIGASPLAQFYGQLIGSALGSVAAACVYKLYTSVYAIPSDLFQVPTAYVWIFTARLVTGQGLPPMAPVFALAAGIVWAILTALRVALRGTKFHPWIPGGVAVAVGMYNVPSFTLARAVGGAISLWWNRWRGGDEAPVVVLASGLILGEGVVSIVNLALASLQVPHL